MVVGGKFGHREGPPWLGSLLAIREFFGHCATHMTAGRNEKNHFCFECERGPLCPAGVAESHRGHATVQIRKASHRDVVRVIDIHRLLDFSDIQLYTINSAKILFLQSRRQPQHKKVPKGGTGGGQQQGPPPPPPPLHCHTCLRSIADPVRFCSLLCKLTAIRENAHDFTISLTLQQQQQQQQQGSEGNCLSGGRSHGVSGTDAAAAAAGLLPDFFCPSTPKAKARVRKTAAAAKDSAASKKRRKMQMQMLPGNFQALGHHHHHHAYTFGNHPSLSPSSAASSYALLMPPPPQEPLPFSSEFQHSSEQFSHVFGLVGPSTPKGMESLSSRVRQRKQVHPSRAPLF